MRNVRTSIMVVLVAAVSVVVAFVLRRSSAAVQSPEETLAVWG